MPAALLFGRARETLDSSADGRLSAIAELVAAMEPLEIVVIGRDDTVDLARQRAHAVAAWLTAHQPPIAPPHLIEQADKPPPAEDVAQGATRWQNACHLAESRFCCAAGDAGAADHAILRPLLGEEGGAGNEPGFGAPGGSRWLP